jgi:hypothetical protein
VTGRILFDNNWTKLQKHSSEFHQWLIHVNTVPVPWTDRRYSLWRRCLGLSSALCLHIFQLLSLFCWFYMAGRSRHSSFNFQSRTSAQILLEVTQAGRSVYASSTFRWHPCTAFQTANPSAATPIISAALELALKNGARLWHPRQQLWHRNFLPPRGTELHALLTHACCWGQNKPTARLQEFFYSFNFSCLFMNKRKWDRSV